MRRFLFVLGILMLAILSACSNDPSQTSDHQPTKKAGKQIVQDEQTKQITLSAVGDILIHDRVYNVAKTETGYDFMPMMKQLKPFLSESTITFANQETMIGGEDLRLSSYPSFNSPVEIGDALKELGVDVVSIANNHSLDRGEDVIQSAIQHWDKLGMMYVGAYKNKADQETVRVYKTDEGIDVAFVAYTYGTNGIPIPSGKEYLVNIIDKEKIAHDIKEAKKRADVVVASLHFGTEYEKLPNEEQKDLAQFAVDAGADLILGHHPHVLQPVDELTAKDGHKAYVVYSLGNFFSGQHEENRRIGGIFTVIIDKNSNGIKIHSPTFIPTHVSDGDWQLKPLSKATNKELPDAKNVYQKTKEHMTQWLPELKFIPGNS